MNPQPADPAYIEFEPGCATCTDAPAPAPVICADPPLPVPYGPGVIELCYPDGTRLIGVLAGALPGNLQCPPTPGVTPAFVGYISNSNVYTSGNPPAGWTACGQSTDVELVASSCVVNATTGAYVGRVFVEATYDTTVTPPVFVGYVLAALLANGTVTRPYTLAASDQLEPCPAGAPQMLAMHDCTPTGCVEFVRWYQPVTGVTLFDRTLTGGLYTVVGITEAGTCGCAPSLTIWHDPTVTPCAVTLRTEDCCRVTWSRNGVTVVPTGLEVPGECCAPQGSTFREVCYNLVPSTGQLEGWVRIDRDCVGNSTGVPLLEAQDGTPVAGGWVIVPCVCQSSPNLLRTSRCKMYGSLGVNSLAKLQVTVPPCAPYSYAVTGDYGHGTPFSFSFTVAGTWDIADVGNGLEPQAIVAGVNTGLFNAGVACALLAGSSSGNAPYLELNPSGPDFWFTVTESAPACAVATLGLQPTTVWTFNKVGADIGQANDNNPGYKSLIDMQNNGFIVGAGCAAI